MSWLHTLLSDFLREHWQTFSDPDLMARFYREHGVLLSKRKIERGRIALGLIRTQADVTRIRRESRVREAGERRMARVETGASGPEYFEEVDILAQK